MDSYTRICHGRLGLRGELVWSLFLNAVTEDEEITRNSIQEVMSKNCLTPVPAREKVVCSVPVVLRA